MKNLIIWTFLIAVVGVGSFFVVANRPAKLLFYTPGSDYRSYTDSEIEAFRSRILTVDAREDARKRYRLLDKRFVGVAGYAISFPGIEGLDSRYLSEFGYKEILGGTDYIQTEEQAIHNDAIYEYALNYNSELLFILKEKQPQRPNN